MKRSALCYNSHTFSLCVSLRHAAPSHTVVQEGRPLGDNYLGFLGSNFRQEVTVSKFKQ
jgi:hypothetical protein